MKFNRWTLALASCGLISMAGVVRAQKEMLKKIEEALRAHHEKKCTAEWGGVKMELIEEQRRCAFCGSIALSFSELCSSCKDEWDAV